MFELKTNPLNQSKELPYAAVHHREMMVRSGGRFLPKLGPQRCGPLFFVRPARTLWQTTAAATTVPAMAPPAPKSKPRAAPDAALAALVAAARAARANAYAPYSNFQV